MSSVNNNQLWDNLKSLELDDPDSAYTFSDRLARENGWKLGFAIRCVEEYKRFIFLVASQNYSLTPSDEVDQVWHLHLLYTQSYWNDMCQNILKKQIHHGPTKGGQQEKDKFSDNYLKTLEIYRRTFNEEPPTDIWPPSKIRFTRINFRRVNVDENWIIMKPGLIRG